MKRTILPLSVNSIHGRRASLALALALSSASGWTALAATRTFASLANGAALTVDGVEFRINYDGGTGNDVVLTVLALPAPPPLAITCGAANALVISWPAPAEGWLLHGTTNLLASGSAWTEIPPPHATHGPNCEVTESAAAGARFYRLHKP